MKKIFTTIIFLITLVLDVCSIMLNIYDLKLDKVVFAFILLGNIVSVSLCVLLVLELYKRKKMGTITIDGIDLTVIGQKNLSRKKIKTLEVNHIEYEYIFSKNGFDAYIRYKGSVIKKWGTVNGININFSGDSNQRIDDIDAYAYDLIYDREQKYKIDVKSVQRDGLNKEVFFKFNHPLKRNEKFDYLFHYRWNNCVNSDKDYIAAIPPFENINPREIFLKVRFEDKHVKNFETYSFNKYSLKEEERVTPITTLNGQVFEYKYVLEEGFEIAIAFFHFE